MIRWLRERPYALSVVILSVGVITSLWIDRSQNADREADQAQARIEAHVRQAETQCQAANATRELIREIGVELSVANAEALISVVSEEADPTDVEQYRAFVRANAEDIVSVLTDRDCEAEADTAEANARRIEEEA